MKKYVQKISKYKPSTLQGTLHLEVARPRQGLAIEYPLERRALSLFGAVLVLLVFAYLYFVAASILNIMSQKEALQQVDQLDASIGSLEQQYFTLSQDVSPQVGAALGLAPIKNTSYVYRPGNAAVADVSSTAI